MATTTTLESASADTHDTTANRLDIQEETQRNTPSPSKPIQASTSQLTNRSDSIDLDLERGMKLDNLRTRREQAEVIQPPPTASSRQSRRSSASSHSGSSASWDPTHPCYPHANPHVPAESRLETTTRIIRIPRDFMVYGDVAPAYSNIYPRTLEPYMDEERFRTIIKTLNEDLKLAFDPWSWRNWLDAGVGVLTFWLAEDIFGTEVKRRLKKIEMFIEEQNRQMLDVEKKRRMPNERDSEHSNAIRGVAKIIPLRRTGYMNLDIQIPNPFPHDNETSELEDEEYQYVEQPPEATDAGSVTNSTVPPQLPPPQVMKPVKHQIMLAGSFD